MITLSVNGCPPLCFFVLINFNCSLSAEHLIQLHVLGHYSCTSRQILFAPREQQLPYFEPHIFTFLYKGCYYSTKDNQVTRSEVIYCRILQRNVLKSHFIACEKVRWQVEEYKGLQEWCIRNFSVKSLHLLTYKTVFQSIGIPSGRTLIAKPSGF